MTPEQIAEIRQCLNTVDTFVMKATRWSEAAVDFARELEIYEKLERAREIIAAVTK